MQEAKPKNANKGLLIGIICGIAATIAIVIVIIILLLTGGKADLIGTWKLVNMKEGDKEYDVEKLEKFGYEGKMVFKEDGTGTLKMSGTGTKTFEYDKEKMTATVDGDAADLKVSGNKLTIESDSVTMTFEKQ